MTWVSWIEARGMKILTYIPFHFFGPSQTPSLFTAHLSYFGIWVPNQGVLVPSPLYRYARHVWGRHSLRRPPGQPGI
jgi:hypothetical protein